MQSWSVVVMCYNEEKTVKKVAESILELFTSSPGRELEIIIVDDGSKDGSLTEIKKVESEHEGIIKYIAHPVNLGIGMTLRDGYKAAIHENVCGIPADGQFDISDLKPYLDFEENQLVSFYREVNLHYSVFRDLLSLMNKKINYFFLKIDLRDVNWVKSYKTKAIQALQWKLTSSLIESELCAKLICLGVQPVQVKSNYLPRRFGVSKGSSFKIVLQALKETTQLILIIIRFRRKTKKK